MLEFIFKPISSGRTGRVILLSMVLVMIFLLTTCRKEEVATKEYPRLNTLEVTGINESGATFNAEIISGNTEDIIEYGFVWDTENDPDYTADDRYTSQGAPGRNQISVDIHSSLKKKVPYYVRAYLKTAKYLVYGKTVSFISLGSEAPKIIDFSPKLGSWSDTIKVTGKNFRYKMSEIGVKLGDIPAKIISSTDTTINLVVPATKNSEKVNLSVSILGNTSVCPSQFSYIIPVISDIRPLLATFNDTVYIRGSNFFKNIIDNKVYFNELNATIVYASRTLIKVLVPTTLTLNQARISVSGPVTDIEFSSFFSLKAIVLKSFEPDTIFHPSGIITIRGENFNPLSINNTVIINGFNATIVESASEFIKAKLPDEVIPYKYLSTFTNVNIAIKVGEQNSEFNKNIEIYWKSRWTKKKNFPGDGRFCSVGFSIGEKGYFGTGDNSMNYDKNYLKDFWEYDPLKDEWKRKADFPGEARSNATSFVLKDKGYIGLGGQCDIWQNTASLYFNDYYKYDPATDVWTKISDYPGKPRYSAASFVINDLAYVGTGRISYDESVGTWDESIVAKDFWHYNYFDNKWHEDLDFPFRTQYAKGFSMGNKGYIYESGNVKEYKVNSWEDKCSISNVLVLGEILFSIDNIGYILYGTSSSELLEINGSVDLIKRTSIPYETGIVASFAPSAFTVKDKAYIISGIVMYSYPSRFSQEVWEFDPKLPIE